MARLAIIIPHWHDAELLETTLISVLQNRPNHCEVVVVHPGTYEDPYELSDEVTFIEVDRNCGIITAVNAAVEQTECDVLNLLQAGVEVAEGWTDEVIHHFDDPKLGSVIPLVLDAQRPTHLLAAGSRLARGGSARDCGRGRRLRPRAIRRSNPVAPSAFAGFYRKSAVQSVGMFEAAVGYDLAALDMGLSLRNAGYRSALELESRVFAHANSVANNFGWFNTGRQSERVLWRNSLDHGWMKTWLPRLPSIAFEALVNLPRPKRLAKPLGRAIAWTEWRRYRRHHQRLRSAAETSNQTDVHLRDDSLRIDAPHRQIRPTSVAREQRVHVN